MKLTTTTFVSVDAVMQGIGGPDQDRSDRFEDSGWTTPLWDNEAGTFLNQIYQRADAFPFARRHLRDLRRLLQSKGRSGQSTPSQRRLTRGPSTTPPTCKRR